MKNQPGFHKRLHLASQLAKPDANEVSRDFAPSWVLTRQERTSKASQRPPGWPATNVLIVPFKFSHDKVNAALATNGPPLGRRRPLRQPFPHYLLGASCRATLSHQREQAAAAKIGPFLRSLIANSRTGLSQKTTAWRCDAAPAPNLGRGGRLVIKAVGKEQPGDVNKSGYSAFRTVWTGVFAGPLGVLVVTVD